MFCISCLSAFALDEAPLTIMIDKENMSFSGEAEEIEKSLGLKYEKVLEANKGIFLDYEDLVILSMGLYPPVPLKEKLNKQLNTPVVLQPEIKEIKFLHGRRLGDFFRVAQWNIERGFSIDKVKEAFLVNSRLSAKDLTKKDLPEKERELAIISKASVIVLNEVDYGLPRTEYKNIAYELASALMAGYVFAPEFIEVNPYQLGVLKFTEKEKKLLEDETVKQIENIDKKRYLGLHGTAVVTKYPIIAAEVVRLPDCYDWFVDENSKLAAIEKVKRVAAEKIFATKVLTELRRGGRMALLVKLLLPNDKTVTVVATHVENRCEPECRQRQLKYLLNVIKVIDGPIILAGDFNTTGTDASPTSVKKEIVKKVKDPSFVIRQAIWYLTPLGIVEGISTSLINKFKNYRNPTSVDIPVLLPNKEKKFFNIIEDFRFKDGNVFDIRGVEKKTRRGMGGDFANSNEREEKGFKTTFELNRAFGIAKFKLDWIFVKPSDLKDSSEEKASYAFAPHFGRTLQDVNRAFGERLSDHDPITVDIPVEEPKK